MSRSYAVFNVDGQTPTSTGTQDFTVPGVGSTPVGCVVVAVRATSYNNLTAGTSLSWGAADGTNTYCSSYRAEDNVGTTDTQTTTTTDLIRILDPSGGAEEVVGEFDSFITNGVRIDFTTVDTSQYRFFIILYFGSDCETYAFFADPPATVDTSVAVSAGFEASYVLTAAAGVNTSGGALDALQAWFGIAVNDGSDTNCSAGCLGRDSSGTTETRRAMYTDALNVTVRLNSGTTDLFGGETSIEDYDSSGFDVYSRTASNAGRIIGLAVRVPSSLSISIETNETFESSTGDSDRTSFGSFLPGFWYLTHAANSTVGFANFGATCMGTADARIEKAAGQYSATVCSQHNQSTSNEQVNITNRNIHSLRGNNGNELETGKITERDDGSYTVDVKTVTGTQRLYNILIVEELPFENEVVVDLPAMNADIDAELTFDADITAALPSPSADIDAEQLFDATIDVVFPSMAADIEAEAVYDASIGAALPSVSVDIDADQLFDATVTAGLSTMNADLVADQLFDAVIAAGLPAVAAELEAELQLDATIGAGFATMSATLVADAEAFAAITAGLPAAQAVIEAELDQDVDAVITAALAAMEVDIEASSLTEATIDAGLPAQDADLDAEALYDAAISAGLPAADADLDADVSNDAVIVAGLASVDADLDAELRLDAVINVGLPAINAELRDFLILGCDTELLGTKEQVVNLLGTSDVETALLGNSDVETALEGSSNITTDLAGTSDTMVDLEGEHC